MDFLISAAHAQSSGAASGSSSLVGLLPLIGMFVLFYFILIRPQQKRMKEHRNLIAALKKGDEIVTNGGLYGKLTEVGESCLTVELADNVAVKLQRSAVAAVMPKGTLKNIS